MTCREHNEQITPAVDHYLRGVERDLFEDHARRCPPCSRAFESERHLKQFIRHRMGMVATPEPLLMAVRLLIQNAGDSSVARVYQYQAVAGHGALR